MLNKPDFPVRPQPRRDESIGGFLCRYFGSNGHRIPSNYLSALQEIYREPRALSEGPLRELCIDTVSIHWLARQLQLLDKVPKRGRTFILGKPQVCPLCLKQDGFYHNEWDFPLVSACPCHGVMLRHQCECRRPLSWHRFRPGWYCSCNLSASDLPVIPAGKGQIWLSHFLIRRLNQPTARLSQIYGYLAQLDELLLRLASLTGQYKRTRADRHEALHACLLDWPYGLQAILANRWQQALSTEKNITYQYLHAGTPAGILIRWLRSHHLDEYRLFKRYVVPVFRYPNCFAYCSTIQNPLVTIAQYQQRLTVFLGWWRQVTALLPGQGGSLHLSKSTNQLHSKNYRCFTLRLSLLNNWIIAADLAIPPLRFIDALAGITGRPSPPLGYSEETIVEQIDKWLTSFHERELQQLSLATSTVLSQEAGHV